MNEEVQPKVLYKITAYDSDYIKEQPYKVRTLRGYNYYYYDFKKHRYLSQFVSDDFDIYDELKSKQDRIEKAIEYIENDLQSFIYSCEYKTLLKILKGSDK